MDFLFPATACHRGGRSRTDRGFNSVVDFLFPATILGPSLTYQTHVSIPLWIFCSLRQRLRLVCRLRRRRFNSVVDFLFPATVGALGDCNRDDMFQFRCGFSVPCDHDALVWDDRDHRVSIPLWIFCSLRHPTASGEVLSASFNSVVDFLFPATALPQPSYQAWAEFQFRCGFSVPCDKTVNTKSVASISVSIPLWIFCSLRPDSYRTAYGGAFEFQFRCGFSVPCDKPFSRYLQIGFPVSIPLWIFCSLRLQGFYLPFSGVSVSIPLWIFCSLRQNVELQKIPEIMFQFRCGFSVPCDPPCVPAVAITATSFNSVVDFLFPATRCSSTGRQYREMFQFRCGFSVPCDGSSVSACSGRDCFNSVVDFLFPATLTTDGCRLSLLLFQFRCGFSVPCDSSAFGLAHRVRWFQFRCGFSVPCDAIRSGHRRIQRCVSIPLWIFCSLRPFRIFSATCSIRVSIPLWIFCSLRQEHVDSLADAVDQFQFRCGFSVPCDLMSSRSWLSNRSFQFRCGFSVPCDKSFSALRWPQACFNSVVDFLFPATPASRVVLAVKPRFNSVVDFLFPATCRCEHFRRKSRRVSIPLWIFCSLRQKEARDRLRDEWLFQFRCGFSVPCDLCYKIYVELCNEVSIPLWIFCSLRPCNRGFRVK